MDKNRAIDVIRRSSLSERVELLVEYFLPSARILVREQRAEIGDGITKSHFGGLPSLPRDFDWPTWDKHDYMVNQISRLEARHQANPRAKGLRDLAVLLSR